MHLLLYDSINSVDVYPIKALIYVVVINEVITVPLLVAIMKIENDKKILEGRTNSKISNIMGWLLLQSWDSQFWSRF